MENSEWEVARKVKKLRGGITAWSDQVDPSVTKY